MIRVLTFGRYADVDFGGVERCVLKLTRALRAEASFTNIVAGPGRVYSRAPRNISNTGPGQPGIDSIQMIYPVILCGGPGSRSWPPSRALLPKQFLPLVSDRTMLQETAACLAELDAVAAPLIVSNAEHQVQGKLELSFALTSGDGRGLRMECG